MNYSIDSALHRAILELSQVRDELDLKPRFESELLLAFVLGVERVFLHTNGETLLDSSATKRFFHCINERKSGKPIEYITKTANFYGLEFFVDESVLIPRSESEILIDKASEIISAHNLNIIAEVGIGAGIITTLLARKHHRCTFLATDISSEALKVAKANITLHAPYADAHLLNCSLLPPINAESSSEIDTINANIELIVSNPPYIRQDYKIPKPLSYEPSMALFGGSDGLDVIKELINIAAQRRVWLVCEIGYDQKALILKLLKAKNATNIDFYKDLSGFDRGFVARF